MRAALLLLGAVALTGCPQDAKTGAGKTGPAGKPPLDRKQVEMNEGRAIGALKTIGISQNLFREGDKEGDGTLDYGTLQELGATKLIDEVLATGVKSGYRFTTTYGPQTSEFLWHGTAVPTEPGRTGHRYFASNHEGVIWYSEKAPIEIGPDSRIKPRPDVKPVGK